MSITRNRETTKRAVLVTLPPVVKKSSKSRSFHFRYLELCRAKNITPVPNLRSNPNTTTFLDLCGDKLGVSEWLLINEALYHDLVLQTVVIRMRRLNGNNIILPIDTENRARLFRQKPVIYTRFIFNSLVEAICNCVKLNKNLSVLKLEGLPLQDGYIECIAQALASNDCLKELSFMKSYIGDKGCEAVCSTVKYLNHVEIFNVAECNIGPKGAEHVADMIKMQKITRFSEGWEKSLRYRSVDINSISGLRNINLANNPNLGDDGVRYIGEVLKEDAWVKTIDMEGCGLTDRGANIILECLSLNSALTEFNVHHNEGISKFLMRQIRDHFGKEDEEKLNEPQYDLSCINGLQSLPKGQKFSISQLLSHTKSLEEQLSFERTLRKKAEKLNEKLNQQLMCRGQISTPQPEQAMDATKIPKGYMVVKGDYMQSYASNQAQRHPGAPFNQLVNSEVTSPDTTPRSDSTTLRNQRKMHESEHLQTEPEEDEASSLVADDHQQPPPRQLLQVRKVRSEMKYVETFNKDSAKKHESKSDHEFANERDFKLNPKVQFEMDIGDSVMVNQQQLERRGFETHAEEYEGSDYEQGSMQKPRNHDQYEGECIGDGVAKDTRKHIAKIKKRYGESGNSHMAVYMDELERKISSKSGKKRHKSKMPASVSGRKNECEIQGNNMNPESYMAQQDEALDSPSNGSGSDGEKADGQAINTYNTAPMKVFVRRTHYESESVEVEHQNDDGEIDENLISPRSVYLGMQRKQTDKNH